MNEEALNISYQLFKSGGYSKSIEEYSKLLKTNKEALRISYDLFKTGGYSKSIDDFSLLVGASTPIELPESKTQDTTTVDTNVNIPVDTETSASVDSNVESIELPKSEPKKENSQKKDILSKIRNITAETIKLDEDTAVEQFKNNFSQYGFSFDTSGIGDAMVVTAPDGSTQEVDLQPFLSSSNQKEADKLSSFLLSKSGIIDQKTKTSIEEKEDPAIREALYRMEESRALADSMREKFLDEAGEIESIQTGSKRVVAYGGATVESPIFENKPKWESMRAQAEEIAKKRGDVSPENIEDLAKRLYANDRRRSYLESQEKAILSDYEDEYGPGLVDNMVSFLNLIRPVSNGGGESLAGVKYKEKLQELKKYFREETSESARGLDKAGVEISVIENQISSLAKERESLVEKYKKEGELSEEEMNREKDLYTQIISLQNEGERLLEVYGDKMSDVEDYKEMAMSAGVNYNSYDKHGTTIKTSLMDLGAGAVELFADYNAPALIRDISLAINEQIYGEEIANKAQEEAFKALPDSVRYFIDKNGMQSDLQNVSDKITESVEQMRSGVREDYSVDSIEDFGSFLNYAIDLAVGNATTLAVTMALPEYGIYALGAAAAGNKAAEMRREEKEFGIEYNIWQKLAAPIMYGAAEAFSEKVKFDKFTKGINKVVGKVSKRIPGGENVLDLANIEIPSFKRNLKSFGVDVTEEGVSEAVSQIGQNFSDIAFLGKEDVGLFDGVDEAFISGATLGAMFQTPGLVTETAIWASTPGERIRRLEHVKGLAQVTKEINAIVPTLAENPENKNKLEKLRQQYGEHTRALAAMMQQSATAFDRLNTYEKREFGAITNRINHLNTIRRENWTESQRKEYASLQVRQVNLLRKGEFSVGQNGIQAAMDSAPYVDATIETVENNEELDQFLKENNLHTEEYTDENGNVVQKYNSAYYNEDGSLITGNGGVIITDPDGSVRIVYNKSEASSQFNVGAHELIHRFVNKLFGIDQGTFKTQWDAYQQVRMTLPKSQRKKLDAYYNGRIEKDYQGNFEAGKGEAFTILSDAIQNNVIDTAAVATVGDKINFMVQDGLRLFSRKKYGENIKITTKPVPRTPRELFNFIKNVTEQSATGKIDQGLYEGLFNENAKPGNDVSSIQSSRRSTLDSLEDKLYNGEITIEEYESRVEQLNKKEDDYFKSKTKKADKTDFKSILDEAGKIENFDPNITPFEVMDTIVSMIKIKARGFKTTSGNYVNLESLPSFDIDDFASEVFYNMMAGKKNADGTVGDGYLKVFNPAANDSFYGYINAQIGNRMRSVLEQGEMTQEKFTVQVEQQVDLSQDEDAFDEFDTIEQETIRESKKIDPRKIAESKYVEKITSEIDSKIGGLSLDDLIFKNTPNLATATLAEVFEVREVAIQKAAQNLNSGELSRSAPVLAKMADTLLEIMPNGAIVYEGGELAISEKLIGTGTGLPRKILDAFYVKGRRLLSEQEGVGRKGAGLEPFNLKEGLTREEFLAGVGIDPEGKNITAPKTSEAQTRRAVLDLVGKLMTNTQIRAEMEKRGHSVLAINNLAAGKSTVQLASSNKKYNSRIAEEMFKSIDDPAVREDLMKTFVGVYGEEGIEQMTDEEIALKAMDLMESSSKNIRIDQYIKDTNNLPEGVDRNEVLAKRKKYRGKDYFDKKSRKNKFEQKADVIREKQAHGYAVMSILPREIIDFHIHQVNSDTGKKNKESEINEIMDVFGLTDKNAMVFKSASSKEAASYGLGDNVLLNEDGTVADQNTFNEVAKDKASAFSEIRDKMTFTEGVDTSDPQQVIDAINKNENISKDLKKKLVRFVELVRDNKGLPPTYKYVSQKIKDVVNSNLSIKEKVNEIVKIIKSARGKYNNRIRRAKRDLYIQVYRDYIYEEGISQEERTSRVAYFLQSLRETSEGFKNTASISSGLSLLTTSLESIQFEHIIPASVYDFMIANSVFTGKRPPEYLGGFFDKRISDRIDQTRISVINSIGDLLKKIKVKTGFNKLIRYNDLARNSVLSIKSTDEGVRLIQASRYDGEARTVEEEASMMDTIMGGILKKATGIPVGEKMSQSTAKLYADTRKKRFRWMSPSAEDFGGLLYAFLGKGKEGEAQWDFFQKTLIDPLNDAYVKLTHARQEITNNYKNINKKFPNAKKSLNKKIGYKNYTNDHAVRFYLYKKNGESNRVLGVTEADEKALIYAIESNPELLAYAEELSNVSGDGSNWASAKPQWTFGSVHEDVERVIDDVKRAEFFQEWKANADAIFSENNLNKIEAHYGTPYRESLENMLYRIEKGKAIPEKTTRELAGLQKWLSGSVAVTMFFNRRSAILQLSSFTNYMNWTDNNPLMFGKALANINQFAKDLARIFNSDYLKERRGGLSTEVEASVLANELRKGPVDGFRGVVNKMLKYGFTLTQIGDSLAISFGGAAFYRNRKNTYLSKGLTEQQAHDKAWLDFIEATEKSQQSARPDKLSQQQTTTTGRLFLAFQNTPMQYYRIVNKAAQDLSAGRGNPKEHISKIVYYSAVQGIVFSALQQALFAFLGDGDEEDEDFTEEKQKRTIRVINNVIDTMLKGSGLHGAYAATIKNALLEFNTQEQKGFKADHARTIIEMLNLSAPIGIKFRTLYQEGYMNYKYNKEIIEEMGLDIDNPAYDIAGSIASFGFNVPVNKVINTIRGFKEAADSEHENWQRVALALGWTTWNLGIPNEKIKGLKEMKALEKKEAAKTKRDIEKSTRSRSGSREGKKR